jgi:hypothetical protein
VTHEVAVIHGDVATTTPSGDLEDGNAASAAARAEQTLRRLRPQLARGGRHEIGVSEQRPVLGEGSTDRRNPRLRLSHGIVGSIGAISCVFPANVYGRVHVEQNPCLEPFEATDIVLRVLSEPSQNKFQDTVFGFAVVPTFATVYYDNALRSAKRDSDEFEVPIILGCVIAHELGHLLLGSNSHSGSGVMQPRWERKQLRQAMTNALLFTPEQSKLIQAEAQTRTSMQSAKHKAQGVERSDEEVTTAAHFAESLVAPRCGNRLLYPAVPTPIMFQALKTLAP